MRPVNLLPERARPRAPSGGGKGSSYFLLGALALLLLGAVVYVMTLNSINSSKDKITQANAEAARDTALANQLSPYGDFEKIKAQRVSAVTQLAQGRMDWERTVRELSRVLPQGVWLTSASASQDGKSTQAAGAGPTSTPPGGGAASSGSSATQGPTLTVDGCAGNQTEVAATLVRLHELQGATDVQLSHSSRPSTGSGSSSGGSTGGSSSGSGGCGGTGGQPNYSFEATVTLSASSANTSAPPWLGGGA